MRNNKLLFLGIALIHLILYIVLVQGFATSFNLPAIKQNTEEVIGKDDRSTVIVVMIGYLIGTAGGSNGSVSSSTYQLILVIIISLAVIWSTRQVIAKEKPRIRDSFYKGMYPLVPFTLVIIVVILQLTPLLLGNLIYSTVAQNGLAVTAIEKAIWLLLYLCLALLSLYMITSSLFALYISTLPDMTPIRALRSARELVLHRRLGVSLRIISLPLALCLIILAIIVPLLFVSPLLAQIIFLILLGFSLIYAHIYMYLLYRSLL